MNRKADRVKMERTGRQQQGSLRKCLNIQMQELRTCNSRARGLHSPGGSHHERQGTRALCSPVVETTGSGLCCMGLNPSSNVSQLMNSSLSTSLWSGDNPCTYARGLQVNAEVTNLLLQGTYNGARPITSDHRNIRYYHYNVTPSTELIGKTEPSHITPVPSVFKNKWQYPWEFTQSKMLHS